jgi:hypothetical protein
MATDDLWGELPDVEEIKTPFVLLKEQAELLTEKTDGLLVGEVTQRQVKVRKQGQPTFTFAVPTLQGFQCTFDIVVPTLNNYKYSLLSLVYKMMTLYPLDLSPANEPSVSCSDEEEFKKELGKILKSQKTQDIISKLLAHVQSA